MEKYKTKIWFLATISLLVQTGFGIIFPIFPLILGPLGHGAMGLGLLAAAFGITHVIFAPIFGTLADKHGKKKIIIIGLLGFSVSNIMYVWASKIGVFEILLIARAIEGAFSAAVFPAAIAMVSDIVPETERGKNIGIITAGSGIGLIAGPVLGGYLFEISLYFPFYASASLAMLTVIWGVFVLPDTHLVVEAPINQRHLKNSKFQKLSQKIKDQYELIPNPKRVFALFILVDASHALSWMIVEPGFSFYIYDDLNLRPRDFGAFIAAYGFFVAVGEGLLGQLSDKYGRRPLIISGMIMMGLFYVVLIYAKTTFQLVIAASLAGIALGFVGPAMKALISDAAPPEARTTIIGLASGLVFISIAIGPIIGGFLYERYTMDFIFKLSILVCAIGTLFAIGVKFDSTNTPNLQQASISENIPTSLGE